MEMQPSTESALNNQLKYIQARLDALLQKQLKGELSNATDEKEIALLEKNKKDIETRLKYLNDSKNNDNKKEADFVSKKTAKSESDRPTLMAKKNKGGFFIFPDSYFTPNSKQGFLASLAVKPNNNIPITDIEKTWAANQDISSSDDEAEEQAAEESIPLSFKRIGNPQLRTCYDNNIAFIFSSAIQEKGEFSNVLHSLRVSIPPGKNDELLADIQSKKQKLEELYKTCQHQYAHVQKAQRKIASLIRTVMEVLDQWINDYEYLTEGWGQFEEHESDDPNYDPKAANTFLKRLSNKYVIETIEETPHLSVKKFISQLSLLQKGVYLLISTDTPIVDCRDEVQEVDEFLKDLYETAEEMANALHGEADEIDSCRDDEKDSAMKHKSDTLRRRYVQFNDLYERLSSFHDKWSELSELTYNYLVTRESIEETERYLTEEMTLLRARIESATEHTSYSTQRKLLEANLAELEPVSLSFMTQLIHIFLRDELKKSENGNSVKTLKEKMENVEKELIKIISKDDNYLKNVTFLLHFVELVRIDRKIAEIEREVELKLIETTKPIASAIPSSNDITNNQHYAFAHLESNAVVGIRKGERKHGAQSPLVDLVGTLATRGTALRDYCGLLHLCYVPPHNILSRYEVGLLSILKISLQKVANFSIYEKSKMVPLVQNSKPSFEWIQAHAPAYFSKFIPPLPYSNPPEILDFSIDVENLYMGLTMYLVHRFLQPVNRQSFDLPEGHPIVCLIVSKEGKILAWAVNTLKPDVTRHAETNALNIYFMQNPNHQFLPDGVRIFTSLKSCDMCSGGIVDCLNPATINTSKVIYGQMDPGQNRTHLTDFNIEVSSTLQISGESIFTIMNQTYMALKNSEKSSQKNITTNAAESLYNPAQQKHLEKIVVNFITFMSSTNPAYASVQKHFNSFLELHQLTFNQKVNVQPAEQSSTKCVMDKNVTNLAVTLPQIGSPAHSKPLAPQRNELDNNEESHIKSKTDIPQYNP